MEQITWILIGITALFFVLLTIKNIFNIKKGCAICLSVGLTWITLIILLSTGFFHDKIIIAILMGHTSLGIYYIFEKKVKERFLIFRLPYLLTSIFIIYSILENFNINSLIFILGLWGLFFLIYIFRFNKFMKKLIECCKKW